MTAPIDVCWDFMQPQFRRSLLTLANVSRSYEHLAWDELSGVQQSAILTELTRMSARSQAANKPRAAG